MRLGRRHPVVGVLNLQLASVYHAIGRDYTALEYLIEAEACFTATNEGNPLQFRHEWSDVLMEMAIVAVDFGFLDQAERILARDRPEGCIEARILGGHPPCL